MLGKLEIFLGGCCGGVRFRSLVINDDVRIFSSLFHCHLAVNSFLCFFLGQLVSLHQSLSAHTSRNFYDPHLVHRLFPPSFDKDCCFHTEKSLPLLRFLFDFCFRCSQNSWPSDVRQFLHLVFRPEHDWGQGPAIDFSIFSHNSSTKRTNHFVKRRFSLCVDAVPNFVAVDHVTAKPLKRFADSALPGSNTTGQPNHDRFVAVLTIPMVQQATCHQSDRTNHQNSMCRHFMNGW
mmetsp:Transcript_38194/g.75171  ORF Transcript_38194/g.75171 Transcript_38194/m.75171 type:complete len:234 (-) Transcript_38194:8-709(-)